MVALDVFTLSCIVGLMLAETRLSRRNEVALTARGALTPTGDVWVWMAVLYPLCFVLMGSEGIWRASSAPDDSAAGWYVAGLLLFAAAKGLKYWAITTLGDRWSFRVMVEPGVPLIRTGPYQYIAHPNYVGVAGELIGTAMMMTAAWTGPILCALFGVVLWGRVRFENRILRSITPRAEAGL